MRHQLARRSPLESLRLRGELGTVGAASMALAAAVVLVLASPVRADPPRMVIVQPGYPGSTKEAEGFVGKLSAYLDQKAGLEGLAGEYHNEAAPALRAIAARQPALGIVSTGFYLEHRRSLGLGALLATKPKDSFVLMVRGGDVKDLAALKGQPVAGGPLHERPFLERIVFAGKADVSAWDTRPVLNASRALRDLAGKKHRAVVLTGREHRALAELYRPKNLEKILESEYYPPALVVAIGGPAKAVEKTEGKTEEKRVAEPGKIEEKRGTKETGGAPQEAAARLSEELLGKIRRAFAGLPEDPRGKEILQTMGAEGFEEIRADWLKDLEGRYDGRTEGKSEGKSAGKSEGKPAEK